MSKTALKAIREYMNIGDKTFIISGIDYITFKINKDGTLIRMWNNEILPDEPKYISSILNSIDNGITIIEESWIPKYGEEVWVVTASNYYSATYFSTFNNKAMFGNGLMFNDEEDAKRLSEKLRKCIKEFHDNRKVKP